jgi:glycosyltransferase involved in cell wall biosynthesis
MNSSRFKNIVVSMTDTGPVDEFLKREGIEVYSLGLSRSAPHPYGLISMIKILKRIAPDILQSWLYHSDLLGLVAGKLAGVPHVVWNIRCSTMDLKKYSKLTAITLRLLAWLSSYPDAVIVNSFAGKHLHESFGYRPGRWEVIPNGFDLNKYRFNPNARKEIRRELDIGENTVLIGLVARYDTMKDHVGFLSAAATLVKEKYYDVGFILVGKDIDSHNAVLAEIIREKGLESHVHLMGERADIPEIMSAIDIVTSSSYGEGFPNVIGEAMACGRPCVVTDTGDSALLVGETGLVVPVKDPEAMAAAWKSFIDMGQDGRRRFGIEARERIKKNYNLKDFIKRYERFYEEMVS